MFQLENIQNLNDHLQLSVNRILFFFHSFFYILQGGTVLGQPLKIEKIGETFIPYQVFKDYIRGLSDSTFR